MTEKATFGAGCFWGVEEHFRSLKGVTDTAVGYMGGDLESPTYQQVCSDRTGHAEVVEVVFEPEQVTFEALVREFFQLHDPTQVNRQGPDVGSQYRSVVFHHDLKQQDIAERVRAELESSGRYARPVATQVEPARTFWRAEDYHQQYLARRGGSCSI